MYLIPYQYHTSPTPYLFISTARLASIQNPYRLQQFALIGDQNGIQVLGLWTFVLEDFDYNVAAYISSLDYSIKLWEI